MNEEECKAAIDAANLNRGWILNSFAQIEFLLGDLIVRCRNYAQYGEQTKTVSHSASRRIKKIRIILTIEGPLTQFADEIAKMLDMFEDSYDLRNVLSHGFCTFLHTPDGDAGMQFRTFVRPTNGSYDSDHVLAENIYRLVDLDYQRTQVTHQAQIALELFIAIHKQLQ